MNHNILEKSVIKDLYNNDYSMAELITPTSEEYKEACARSQETEQSLIEIMSPEQREAFYQFMEVYIDMNTFLNEETYKQGVIFGAKFMLEVLE